MRLHRFIAQFNLANDIVEIRDEELINQIKNVFRLGVGDRIILSDGHLNEAVSELMLVEKKKMEARIIERFKNENESKTGAVLFCALLKKENFELVIQKAVECGIRRVVPIVTERTVKLNLNMERAVKIAREAAEQSGRGIVPEISKPLKIDQAIAAAKSELNLFLEEKGEAISFPLGAGRVNGWIGPEGGWTEEEIEMAKSAGFKVVSLGSTTLRGETAAIITSYLLSNL